MSTDAPALPKLIPLPEVAALPWLPYKPSRAALYRWASPAGIRGCRLRTVLGGKLLCTTEADVLAFFESLAAQRDTGTPCAGAAAATCAPPRLDRRAAEPLDAELDAEGIR